MEKNYPGEQWKPVKFDFAHINGLKIEISNFGRVKSSNKFTQGNILKGSMINGYRIIRLKFFKEREEKKQKEFDNAKLQILKLARQLKVLREKKERKPVIAEATQRLADLKKTFSEKIKLDEKRRTIY